MFVKTKTAEIMKSASNFVYFMCNAKAPNP